MCASARRSSSAVETPGLSSLLDERQDLGHDPAGPAHALDLGARLAGDHRQAFPAGRSTAASMLVGDRVDVAAAVDGPQDALRPVVVDDVEQRPGPAASSAPGRSPPRRRRAGRSASRRCRRCPRPRAGWRRGCRRGRWPCRCAGWPCAGRGPRSGRRCRGPRRRGRPASASASSSASAWTRVRGKPSRIAPTGGIGRLEPVEEDAHDRVVGDELAATHVPVGLASERRAGRDRRRAGGHPRPGSGTPSRSARTGAWVPLPAPGAPRSTTSPFRSRP